MAAVDFLHQENPPTWAGVKYAPLDAEGQRKTNHARRASGRAKAFSRTFLQPDLGFATVLQLVLHTSQCGPTPSSSSNRFVNENSEHHKDDESIRQMWSANLKRPIAMGLMTSVLP
ncbi:hypothetical protein TNCV_2626881 [Trichonephila clavipes]|uniref:Uncharacterized protein n=1 Tax=Trichonephila clavipes TaxID=2585209 RepID=A0A8X6W761_TRICX|nr:hypothetical protein TNCV_2626881 [Trichonephila clavipes]